MIKPSHKDLAVILALTILSLIFLIIPVLNKYPINLIPYSLLLLFLPGYSLLAAFNPLFGNTTIIKRIVYSVVLSFIITIILALLLSYTPLKGSNIPIFDIISYVIIFLCIIAIIRRRIFSRRLRSRYQDNGQPRVCEECGSSYLPYEAEEMGGKCECGGNLEYQDDHIYKPTEIVDLNPEEYEKPPLKEETPSRASEKPKKEGIEPSLERPPRKEPADKEPELKEESTLKKPWESEKEVKLEDSTIKASEEQIKVKEHPLNVIQRIHETVKEETETSQEKPPRLINVQPLKEKPFNEHPRKIYLYLDLLLVIIFTFLCVAFVLEPHLNTTPIRTILGVLLVLFLPGYALIASLFPKKNDLDGIERAALSFGLSIAVTPLIGLALNYTPFGIRLDPILVSLSAFTVILCVVAYLRRQRIPEENRFWVDFSGFFNGMKQGFKGESKTSKILSLILVISIILAISTTAYIIVKPKEGEKFTEFYILGPDGKASNYPTNLTSGEEGKVIIGIVNHENAETSYHLVVASNGSVQSEQTVKLANGEKLEIPYNFTAGDPGTRKLEFLLYKLPDNNNIYRSLHLWLNITG